MCGVQFTQGLETHEKYIDRFGLQNSRTVYTYDFIQNDIVELLLQHGANPNLKTYWFKDTVIHFACTCAKDPIPILKLLLKHGADLNNTDGCGRTILFDAIERNKYSLVDFLLSCGLNINHRTKYGYTPLMSTDSGSEMFNKLVLLGATRPMIHGTNSGTSEDQRRMNEVTREIPKDSFRSEKYFH